MGARRLAWIGFRVVPHVPGASVVVVLAALACVSGCGSGQQRVSVFPAPGTLTASPRTQISVRGARHEDIRVQGSLSGAHHGRWREHPDERGTTFTPREPFRPGERVTVHLGHKVAGLKGAELRFRIAGVAHAGPALAVQPAKGPMRNVQRFRSRPDLRPPAVRVTTRAKNSRLGSVFVAPKVGRSQQGPMIIDPSGELVWFHPLAGADQPFDFRAQTFDGKPVLTWWEGSLVDYHGLGVGEIYDTSYRPVATVRAGNGYQADLHEFKLTPRGTALIAVYATVPWDLSSLGGSKDDLTYDQIVQEVDIKTGAVLFEWHSLGNVALSESYQPLPKDPKAVYDPVHVNSIDEEPNGNLLVSGRHTSTVYEIDRRTAKIRWRLGGKRSSFDTGGKELFAWQHDARRLKDGKITLYDNAANAPRADGESRGLVLKLDQPDAGRATARIVREFPATPALLSPSQGNVQTLPGGDVMIGWGGEIPRFTEFDGQGRTTFEARFLTPGEGTYRAYRMDWRATPAGQPDIAIERARGRGTVYASWNGATTVARWRLLAGDAKDQLRAVGDAPRTGFESAIPLPSNARLVAVQALDAGGEVLGTSQPTHIR